MRHGRGADEQAGKRQSSRRLYEPEDGQPARSLDEPEDGQPGRKPDARLARPDPAVRTRCILQEDADFPQLLEQAGQALREGALVAFPTETVYGLGANALDAAAVSGIFAAKGRPADNPLIVHISDRASLEMLASDIPDVAERLMARFWPGPLTLVFHRRPAVPDIVTAGLDTVAVRMPVHPIALRLIQLAGVPVAAPSANRSGRPSPTTAAHVMEDMEGRVPLVVDGGACEVGVESTVLDVTARPPMILRPGGVTREMLEQAVGEIAMDPALSGTAARPRSPGMKYTHYAPVAPMTLYAGDPEAVAAALRQSALELAARGNRVGVLCSQEWMDSWPSPHAGIIPLAAGRRDQPETLASGIFSALRTFDTLGVDVILAEGIRETGIGHAIMNRLRKAAGGRLVSCGKESVNGTVT